MNPQPEKKNRPLDTATSGAMKLPVWINENDEGEKFASPGKLVRSTRDADGNWVDTDYLRDGDLLDASFVCEDAHRIILDWKKQQAAAKHRTSSNASGGADSSNSTGPVNALDSTNDDDIPF